VVLPATASGSGWLTFTGFLPLRVVFDVLAAVRSAQIGLQTVERAVSPMRPLQGSSAITATTSALKQPSSSNGFAKR
jgi:hypothetical protein